MMSTYFPIRWMLAIGLSCLVLSSDAIAQQPEPPQVERQDPTEEDELAVLQGQLADKYRRLEELLFKRADFEASVNPRRAALLKQAYQQSKNRLTQTQLNAIVRLLNQSQLTRAVEGQDQIEKDLSALLTLLLSENRADRIKSEAQKLKEYLRELKRLERLQRAERGRNEGGAEFKDLQKNQGKIADRAGNLEGKMEKDDEAKAAEAPQDGKPQDGKPQDGKPQDGKPQDGKPQDGKPQDGKPQDGKPQDGKPQDGKPQDGKPQDGKPQDGKPQDGKPQDGKPQDGKPQDGKPSDQQDQSQEKNPARKRLQEAEEAMREAQRQLEEANRGESIDAQREAEEKLREAIAELEEILRQMREEEIERMLALLEGRFKRMLQMQLRVYEGTLRLARIPKEQRNRAVDIQANKLAFDERKIVVEADRALNLLLEEGSSIAFPEVVHQMRDDMDSVSERLSRTRIDRLTQGIEEEIILSLEELIEALKQAQQDLEEQKSESQPQQSEPGDEPLVDMLAELRMIRSLQLRINRRTKRYSQMIDDPDQPLAQAEDADLQTALQGLAEREAKLQKITRDIVLGKNK